MTPTIRIENRVLGRGAPGCERSDIRKCYRSPVRNTLLTITMSVHPAALLSNMEMQHVLLDRAESWASCRSPRYVVTTMISIMPVYTYLPLSTIRLLSRGSHIVPSQCLRLAVAGRMVHPDRSIFRNKYRCLL